jgi:dihydrofolate synthase/folylpolyglutamate synthase
VLTVVGSKGKGTAATYAAATLSASGLRTGLVTSPPFRTNRERIRIDGRAIDADVYDRLAGELAVVLDVLGPGDDSGYLSPTGSFTLSGVRHFTTAGVDVIVLEEGLGGSSDEVSLFTPLVVAVTPIFEEHVGIIGDTAAEIAADLIGVVRTGTRRVLSLHQETPVWDVLTAHARAVDAAIEIPEQARRTGAVLPAGAFPRRTPSSASPPVKPRSQPPAWAGASNAPGRCGCPDGSPCTKTARVPGS